MILIRAIIVLPWQSLRISTYEYLNQIKYVTVADHSQCCGSESGTRGFRSTSGSASKT
jgi:hypothetical protein